jgi:hypothetical protein
MMGTSAVTEVGAAAPTVFDKTIQLIFVDPSGARRKVPGYVGEFILIIRGCVRGTINATHSPINIM